MTQHKGNHCDEGLGAQRRTTDTVTHSPSTCPDDLLDLHAGELDLLGELPDGLVGVLVGEGVDVDLHTGRHYEATHQLQWAVEKALWLGFKNSASFIFHER